MGLKLAQALDAGIPGCTLAAVSARDTAAAAQRLAGLRRPVPVVGIDALEPLADVVLECAPPRCCRRSSSPSCALARPPWCSAPAPCWGGSNWWNWRAPMAAASSCRPARCWAWMPCWPPPRARSAACGW
ncbi:hypothetical protein ACFQU7_09395 [Pseudoroseomonas wenyumeiae]